VSLTVRTRDQRLLIEVRDAGPGLDPAKPETEGGVGLRNTSERLTYLYGPDHSLELTTVDRGGLLVAIDVPYRHT
jgi:sensor histidine kinase YesM